MIDFESWSARAKDFHHDGLRQSYTDTGGDGPVILLLHGYPTWSYDWVDIISRLSEKARVIALDWIGYGLSEKPSRHVPVATQIDRLDALLDHLTVDRFHLVAHDYGSTCAQEILDRQDLNSRVDSLTLMNGGLIYHAYRPTLTQKLILTPLGPLITRLLSKKSLRKKLDALRGHAYTDAQFEALWQGIRAENGLKKAHLLQRYIHERAEHWPRWEGALKNWSGRTQLIWGPLDPISGLHVLEPVSRLMPQAQILRLDGVGHFVPDEAPQEVATAIKEFVHA